MTIAIICAGGPSEDVIDFTSYSKEQTIFIGADCGALHLLNAGIIPNEAVGDFDSVSKTDYEKIKRTVELVETVKAEKNETDTELALERALSYRPSEVIFTGVTGGRIDHMYSNLQLLYRAQMTLPTIKFKIMNQTNELVIFTPGTHIIEQQAHLQYISFFAFNESIDALTLQNFKYETNQEPLAIGTTRFTSNELVAEAGSIHFTNGICLMVRSSDV